MSNALHLFTVYLYANLTVVAAVAVDGVPDRHGLEAEVSGLQYPKAIASINREETNVSSVGATPKSCVSIFFLIGLSIFKTWKCCGIICAS